MYSIRKKISSTLVAAITASIFASVPAYASNTYEGVGRGFNANIKVKVSTSEDRITAIQILEHKEDDKLLKPVANSMVQIPKKIVETQKLDVDVISGATFTSNGIKNAVKNALKGTGFDPEAVKNQVKEWEEIGNNPSMNSTFSFTFGKKVLLVQTSSGKSNVALRNETGSWEKKLTDIVEVDTAYTAGQEVYLVSNSKGKNFFKSSDGGESWTNLAESGKKLPDDLGTNRISALFAEKDSLYLVVNTKGIYHSADGGEKWVLQNGNLPVVPERNTYDAKGIWKHEGVLYVATASMGLFKSEEGTNWVQVKGSQGLTVSGAKNVLSAIFKDGKVYIGTADGIYKTSLNDNAEPWSKLLGMNNEQVKSMVLFEGKLFATGRYAKNLYYMDSQEVLRPFGNKPSDLSLNELLAVNNDGSNLIAVHTTGLLKIKPFSKEIKARDVAAVINKAGIKNPFVNGTKLELPVVPAGYSLKISGSDKTKVVSMDGTVTPPAIDTKVTLVLKVTNTIDGTSATTNKLQVTVPAKGKGADDGIYDGSAMGYRGDVKVQVTIGNNKISNVKILEHIEDTFTREDVGKSVVQVPEKIVKEQKIGVDVVSSATYTSLAIENAVGKALKDTDFVKKDSNYIELISENRTGTWVSKINEKTIYVSSANNKSNVAVIGKDGKTETKLTDLNLIESGYQVPGTDDIYLIGQRRGSILAVSKDGGENWNTYVPAGISAARVDSLLVLSENEMLASVNGLGLYRSLDGGLNWSQYNGNLPKNPTNAAQYDTVRIKYVNGVYWVSTRNQGLFTSRNAVDWKAYRKNGLSETAKNVVDFEVTKDAVYITGNDGIWRANLSGSAAWKKFTGYEGAGRELVFENSKLLLLTSNGNIYSVKGTEILLSNAVPAYIAVYPATNAIYDGGKILVVHRFGLLEIKSSL